MASMDLAAVGDPVTAYLAKACDPQPHAHSWWPKNGESEHGVCAPAALLNGWFRNAPFTAATPGIAPCNNPAVNQRAPEKWEFLVHLTF